MSLWCTPGVIWNRMEVGDGVTDFSVHRFGNRHCDGEHDPDCTVGYVEVEVMEKLKPCPFCNDTYIRVHFTKGGNYVVGCNTLNCVCLHSEGKLFNSTEKAVEAWNRRASDDRDQRH